jgi:parallel beta-helix repeat protein
MRFVLVAAAALAVSLPGQPSHAKKLPLRNVACGDTIAESSRIGNSLFDCPGDGLVVGAPGITIDLGGHRIDGSDAADSAGIDNTAGHARVTIRNGVVSNFVDGVALVNAADNAVEGLRVFGSDSGIRLAGATGARIRGNDLHGNVIGIDVEPGSNGNTFLANDASGNAIDGVYVEANENVFTGNTTAGNGTYGFEIFTANDNAFRNNVSNGNDSNGFTIDVDASRNVFRGNRSIGNGADGFEIFSGTGNVFQRNTADENAGHGFVADTNALTLRGNRANQNGLLAGASDDVGLGFLMPAGTEESGSKASGNDDPRECQSSELSCHEPGPEM